MQRQKIFIQFPFDSDFSKLLIYVQSVFQKINDEKDEQVQDLDHQGDELKALLSQATSRADEKELLIFEMEEKVETLSVQLEQYKAGKYFLMDIITYNSHCYFTRLNPTKKGPF